MAKALGSNHGPSVPGSGFGFGMAGSAVGLLVAGLWFGSEFGRLPPEVRANVQGMISYPYIFLCVPIGFVLGVVAGVEYARWGRRRAARRRANNS